MVVHHWAGSGISDFRSPVGPWRYYLIRTDRGGIAGWAVQNRAPCRQGGEGRGGTDGSGDFQGPSCPLAFTRADRPGRRREAGHRILSWNRPRPRTIQIRVSAASWETQPGRRSVPGGRHPPPRAGGTARRWQIVLRAYDDGVAFRYRLPAQEGWPSLVLSDERVVLNLSDDAIATALPLNGFTTSYEKRYEKKLVGQLPGDWLLGLPLLLELPGTGWAAITEANLTDHAGLYLAPAAGKKAALVSRLSPLPGEPKVAVRAALPHESPWRVILIAEEPIRLIESDLLLNLNAPCADTSPKSSRTFAPRRKRLGRSRRRISRRSNAWRRACRKDRARLRGRQRRNPRRAISPSSRPIRRPSMSQLMTRPRVYQPYSGVAPLLGFRGRHRCRGAVEQ